MPTDMLARLPLRRASSYDRSPSWSDEKLDSPGSPSAWPFRAMRTLTRPLRPSRLRLASPPDPALFASRRPPRRSWFVLLALVLFSLGSISTLARYTLRSSRIPPARSPPLTGLGYDADDAYRVLPPSDYDTALRTFVETIMPTTMQPDLLAALDSFPSSLRELTEKTIWQTDKVATNRTWEAEWMTTWSEVNREDGWETRFLDDLMAEEWMREVWSGSEVLRVYERMERGVLCVCLALLCCEVIMAVQEGRFSALPTLADEGRCV